ncbi:hypothetical protein BC831DRAFT_231262 [Entophlyctis helioformis]|nr:hypothetical protein BC831DRAFT_231262 [Entophlyctis helioformis]
MTGTGWASKTKSTSIDDADDNDEDLEPSKLRRRGVRQDGYDTDDDVQDSDDDGSDGDQTNPSGTGAFGRGDVDDDDDNDGDAQDDVIGHGLSSERVAAIKRQKKGNAGAAAFADEDDDFCIRERPRDAHGAKARGGSDNDDDDDMFGDDFEGAQQPAGKTSQIKGQEWRDDFDDMDPENGGVQLEPFNMDRDLEDGAFDESGHFVRKKDANAIHDLWLDGLTKSDMEKARRAHAAQSERAQQTLAADDIPKDANLIWREALGYMKSRETLLTAIQRLAASGSSKTPKWRKKKIEQHQQQQQMDTADASGVEHSEALQKSKADLDRLTVLGTHLFDQDAAAYEKTYEQIVRAQRIKGLIDDNWIPGTPLPPLGKPSSLASAALSKPETMYHYKWGQDATQVFGPFPASHMRAWRDQGFLARGSAWVSQTPGNAEFKPFTLMSFD